MTILEQFIEDQYEKFLQEEQEREIVQIVENHQKIINAFSGYQKIIKLKEEYANLDESTLLEDEDNTAVKALVDKLSVAMQQIGALTSTGSSKAPISGKDIPSIYDQNTGKFVVNPSYQAEMAPKVFQYKKIDSVVGFITGIITWIKNVLLNLISYFTRGIRVALHIDKDAKANEYKELNPFKIIAQAKKAAAVERQYGFGTLKIGDSNGDSIDKHIGDQLKNYISVQKGEEIIKSMQESFALTENLTDDQKDDKNDQKDDKNNRGGYRYPGLKEINKSYGYLVNIDVSKEIRQLKEVLNHFFDLFDEAVGSNGEKLFETTDLEMLLSAISTMKDSLSMGSTTHFDGYKAKLLDSAKLKDNLMRTKVNCDKLNKAFSDTQQIIDLVIKKINTSTIMQATYEPSRFILLSSSTLLGLADVAKLLQTRKKSADILSKNLEKLGNEYSKVVGELSVLRQQWINIGSNITIHSDLELATAELFESGKAVFQTLMLRFTCLTNYVQIISNIENLVLNLIHVNEAYSGRKFNYKKLQFR